MIDWRSWNHPANHFGAASRYALTPFKRDRLIRALVLDPDLEAWQVAERFGIGERVAIGIMSHRNKRLS